MTGATLLKLARAQGKLDRVDSAIEALFAQQLRAHKVRPWVRNHVFIPGRRLELDFAFPADRRAIEIEGEVHRIKARFHGDIEKHALALLHNWTILRLDGRAVRSAQGIAWALELWPDLISTPSAPAAGLNAFPTHPETTSTSTN